MEKKPYNITSSIFLLLLVTVIDFLQGHRLSLSLFYLAPISLITWYHGRLPGVIFSFLSATFWFYIEYYARPYDPDLWIMIWNSVLRLGFFLITTWLLFALRSAFEREKQLARRDHLTMAWNRYAFYEMSEIEVFRARRYKHPLSLAYIDLDNFKEVNDRFDHATGDSLLKQVVKRIHSHIRKTDILCRLGGDEFALLLPETTGETALILMNRIKKDLLSDMKARNWPVTFSIGIMAYEHPPEKLKEIIHEADQLMYSVKRSGKNKIELRTK